MGDADNKSSKLVTSKWYVIHDQNNTDHGEENESSTKLKFETKFIKSSLCDYSDTYILLTGDITAIGGDTDIRVALKDSAPLTNRITHINDEHFDRTENLDIIMPLYNFMKYSDDYSDTSGSLWRFKRDQLPVNNGGNPLDVSTATSSSFK